MKIAMFEQNFVNFFFLMLKENKRFVLEPRSRMGK